MAEPSPVPPISTFVVRFWQEWSAAGSRWRGRIEHVESGRRADFLALDQMLDFLQQMGVTIAVHAGAGVTTDDNDVRR